MNYIKILSLLFLITQVVALKCFMGNSEFKECQSDCETCVTYIPTKLNEHDLYEYGCCIEGFKMTSNDLCLKISGNKYQGTFCFCDSDFCNEPKVHNEPIRCSTLRIKNCAIFTNTSNGQRYPLCGDDPDRRDGEVSLQILKRKKYVCL